MAYNPDVKAIIVFSNSGKSAKLVSAAYFRPSIKGIFFSVSGIGSGTFQRAHAANKGSNKIIPIPILARMSDIFPEVEKS